MADPNDWLDATDPQCSSVGSDALDPMLNAWLRTNGEAAWFGWPSDDKIEALRVEWFKATDLETRKRVATEIQERASGVVPYIPIGQWMGITAYRNSLKGLILGPTISQWNVEKT